MIGMSFISFAALLGISLIAALVLHYLVKYRTVEGFEGFLGKVIVGWLGAWLGSPVLGHWPVNLSFADIYPIPVFLGALSTVFSVVLLFKSLSSLALQVGGNVAATAMMGGPQKGAA